MSDVESESELLPFARSTTPAGGLTDAVLTSAPVADEATVASTVKTALAPTGRSTSASTSPVPFVVPQEPALEAQVHA